MSGMSQPAAGLLKHYLQQRQESGERCVVLRPGMLDRLRDRHSALKRRALEVRNLVATEPAVRVREEAPQAALPVTAPAPTATALISVQGSSKAEKLAALAALAEVSPEARALGTLRETMVFSVGSPDAEVMFVGEAPGAEEERQREPFVGPAGQKLTSIITAMGLSRDRVYISNICKFRPAMEDQGLSNRTPTPEEMRACLGYIRTEIDIIRPRVIVALGATAATGLGLKGPVSRLRGQFYEVQGIPTMVTFHPSYLLREEKLTGGGMQAKRQVWEDMLQVMAKAELPISEKQRGYFRR